MLASQSPRRRELLQLLGLPFGVTVADVTEAPMADETPTELVTRLSRAKAHAVLLEDGSARPGARIEVAAPHDAHPCTSSTRALVIACDTVVALEDTLRDDAHPRDDVSPRDGASSHQTRILGKPRDSADAVEMLNLLRGRSHLVYSAVTVRHPTRGAVTELVETRLSMRSYTASEIAAYVASGDPLDKAGAYAIQHEGFAPVEEIEGCYASVMGLPLCQLARCLRHWGCPPATDVPTACQTYTGHHCLVEPLTDRLSSPKSAPWARPTEQRRSTELAESSTSGWRLDGLP
jgi:predicted house-cleaning NTP pyrophosphatase (Maf/HAM1 superfamily)